MADVQPEALQLADRLDRYAMICDASPAINVAAAELRRQHATIAKRDERIQALEAERANWQQMVWALARVLNCLPSTYSDGNAHVFKAAEKMVADLAAALAEVQALRADAERYRWLRDTSVPPHTFYLSVPVEFHEVKFSRVQVDEYIDAARTGGSHG